MLSPLDIQNKQFSNGLFGYNKRDVDGFLDELIEDYDEVLRENGDLKDRINLLSKQMRHFEDIEESMKEALIVAQSTADDVVETAEKKSELIIGEAELESLKKKEMAKKDVENINKKYETIREEMFIFKTRFKSFMESQMTLLEDFYEDIEHNDDKKMSIKDK